MSLIAVDLAERYSGAVAMDDAGRVIHQWHSYDLSTEDFLTGITTPFVYWHDDPPHTLVVEDVPHGLPFQGGVRKVCRLQGRIIERMASWGIEDRILFYPPALWQREMGVWRQGPEIVIPVSAELGYHPPNLVTPEMKKTATKKAEKIMSDYCAAFLMGRCAQKFKVEQGTYDVNQSSRYVTWDV